MGRKYLRLLALMGACACLTSCALLPEEETVRTAPSESLSFAVSGFHASTLPSRQTE
jgi:hypothetical protein